MDYWSNPENIRKGIDGLIVFLFMTGIILLFLKFSRSAQSPGDLIRLLNLSEHQELEALVQKRDQDMQIRGFADVYRSAFQRSIEPGSKSIERLADQVFLLNFAGRPEAALEKRLTALGFFLNQVQSLPGTPTAYTAITRHLDTVFREWRNPALEAEWKQWGKAVLFQLASSAPTFESVQEHPDGREFLALRPDLGTLLQQVPAPEVPVSAAPEPIATFSDGEGFQSVGGSLPPTEPQRITPTNAKGIPRE